MFLKKLPKLFSILAILFLPFQAALSAETPKAIPLIIDTDMATDDMLALSYLLRDSNFDIKAIILSNNGSTDCQYSYPHLSSMIAVAQHQPISIACGTSQAMGEGHRFPNTLRNKLNLMSGVDFPMSSPLPANTNGIQLLITTLNNTRAPVEILAIGTSTNIATALQEQPQLKTKIAKIYMMGGAINVPGNIEPIEPTAHNSKAEWNIYFDPVATNALFQSKIPIYLVPLDATSQVPVSMGIYNQLANEKRTPLGQLNYQLLTQAKPYIQDHILYFWDPLAALSMDQPICQFKPLTLKVILNPKNQEGALKIDPQGNKINICTNPNTKLFMQIMEKSLNPQTPSAKS